MWPVGTAIAYAVFVWWFSTGIILILVRLPRWTYAWSMLAISVMAIGAVIGLAETRTMTTPVGAFAGFTYGLILWAWHEMSFLFGWVTGPRTGPCPPTTSARQRFRYAFEVILHHEFAILATVVGLVWLSWDTHNQVGTATFIVLWAMRISAKLNVYLGAPKLAEEFLPRHLDYLKTYFRKGRINSLFPFVVGLATLAFAGLVAGAVTATDPFMLTAYTLIAALLGLAIIEHWFLVLPIPDATLWRWALRRDSKTPSLSASLLADPSVQTAPRSTQKTFWRP